MKGIKQIKKYRLIREIGKGATGIVYEAVNDETNKLVAVKAIPSAKLMEKRVMENFKRELKLLHGLNHGNIIKITGVEKTVNNIYLILEYCNGGNLYEYSYYYRKTFGKNLPEKSVQKILRQLIEGLEYMHNCRTVHRDIKLENILINFNSASNTVNPGGMPEKVDYDKVDLDYISVKIADLGYARELEGGGVASTICGTPITMAPDIINLFDNANKEHKYNSKVDLWSLGAITYELLIGRPPFYASNYKQLFEEVMAGKYNLPKNLTISVEAITFINGLLQFYPDKRMDWAEIRSHPFITNEPSTFHIIDLHTVDTKFENPQHLEMNTKDCENFLWIMFKPKADAEIKLDKIDASIIQNPIIDKLTKDEKEEENIAEDNNKNQLSSNKNKDKDRDREDNSFNKRDDSEDNFEDANNEINLCDDNNDEEEKQKTTTNTNTDTVSENKNNGLKDTIHINPGAHDNNSNTSSNNRVFNRILSEMHQELKNSKKSNISQNNKEIKVDNNEKSDLKENNTVKLEVEAVEETKFEEIKPENKENSKEEIAPTVDTVEEKTPDPNTNNDIKPSFPLEDNLPKNPSHNIFESNQVKESKFCIENISEERDTINKGKCLEIFYFLSSYLEKKNPSQNNPLVSDDFIHLNRECSGNRDLCEDDEIIWEIISTTSITENEIQYEIDSDGYQIINEYFK